MIDPKGPANRGSNTAAAIASTAARTSKKLTISPTSSNVTYYSADEMMLRNTVHSHQKGEKAVPGFASTLPRARERGAKAYLRDGGANQPITQNRKSSAGLLHRNHKADTCKWKSDEKAEKASDHRRICRDAGHVVKDPQRGTLRRAREDPSGWPWSPPNQGCPRRLLHNTG